MADCLCFMVFVLCSISRGVATRLQGWGIALRIVLAIVLSCGLLRVARLSFHCAITSTNHQPLYGCLGFYEPGETMLCIYAECTVAWGVLRDPAGRHSKRY